MVSLVYHFSLAEIGSRKYLANQRECVELIDDVGKAFNFFITSE